jgi:hypothetical protein
MVSLGSTEIRLITSSLGSTEVNLGHPNTTVVNCWAASAYKCPAFCIERYLKGKQAIATTAAITSCGVSRVIYTM